MGIVHRTFLFVFAVAAFSGAQAQDNPYHEDGWAKFPDGRRWGWSSAIDIDKRGNIWVFERCGANACAGSKVAPLVQLTPQGKVLRTFGAGMFAWPHGIHIDRAGAIWVADGDGKDGKGHVVVKFSPEGKVLMRLGKAGVAGDGPDTFNRPSDVVTAPNGDIFVADGHGGDSNARIVKFSKDGKFIKTWGKKGSAAGEFNTPHALAMDSKGRLYVGDRGNSRIQIFDQEGNFLEEWRQFGRPSGIYIDKSDRIYVADHQSDKKLNPGFKRGIRIGSAKDGKVAAFIPGLGADPETQSVGEGVVADAKGNVWWAETSGMNVRKFALK
jgi:DNA-binding beta-propeller fold protein YncE